MSFIVVRTVLQTVLNRSSTWGRNLIVDEIRVAVAGALK